jgi:DNA polymerase I-like protein with 3'-5' exonuclease and polymerase domains
MSSVPMQKLLKKDVDLVIDLDYYDYVILVGSEAAKEYAKCTSVTNYAGQLLEDKFICISNPSVLVFKPEGKEGFKRALERIHSYIAGTLVNIDYTKIGDFKGIEDEAEARSFLLEVLCSDTSVVALDTEDTALYPRDGYVIGVSLSYKLLHGRYIHADVLSSDLIDILQQIIDTKLVVFHNMKFDIKMLEYHLGLKFDPSRVHDTMIMHYILDENSPHGLKPLALKYTKLGDYDTELEEFKATYCREHGLLQEEFTYDLIPFNIICKYASMDTAATLELYIKFKPLIDSKFSKLYYDLLIPATIFLKDMEEVGIPISYERMKRAENYLDISIELARKAIYEFPEIRKFEEIEGIIFNPNSVQQLRKVLFDYIGLTPTGKLTATGAISTDSEVLEELSKEHPLPAAILKVRQLGKIKNTYVSKILPELDKDSRVRTNFNLIFTTSGRLSSSGKFNAQQIPRDDPLIKGCIAAPPGYKVVSQDLQTGEMYYAAVLSGDTALQSVFLSREDFHSSIAKLVFDLTCLAKEVKKLFPAMRQSAKAISFGINL